MYNSTITYKGERMSTPMKTIKVPIDLWKRFKKLAYENETTIAYEVEQACNALENKKDKGK